MTPTLDAALLYVVYRDGVTTTSSGAGTDLGRLSDVESTRLWVVGIYRELLYCK